MTAVSGRVQRICPGDPGWPSLLQEIPDCPAWLDVCGDANALLSPTIAIVGTRRATARGLAIARGAGLQAALHGWTVVSGLALGIDSAAHRGALAGQGRTIAVMATGVDITYPRQNTGLRAELETTGCSVSELPPGSPPLKYHFPRRNRIIVGLSQAVLVVEAPLKSGAMITARLALDYNREVFVVPGPIEQDNSKGCHQLLRQGASLFEAWQDISGVLGENSGFLPGNCDLPVENKVLPESAAGWILARLDLEGVRRDDLRQRWPGNEDMWQQGLLALETNGLIRRLPGGRLARSIWVV